MSTGALIFAFNNSDIDYVAMAAWSAKNIRRHLGIGTTMVTDVDTAAGDFDNVIVVDKEQGGVRHFADIGNNVPWYNANRVDAYSLTPYDQTLVLDADYVVASDQLRAVLKSSQDFMCHREAYDMATAEYLDRLNVFGRYRMPMWWATVMMFRRSNTAQYIFDCMQMVRQNWKHYQALYGFDNPTYRNDYALSIAIGIVSGHTLTVDTIPWPLATLLPEHKVEQTEVDSYTINYTDAQKKRKCVGFSGFDFHAMGKRHLGDIVANPK